jgi:hypothetical protein
MPIRGLTKTPASVINAFKEALRKPRLLTADETAEFEAFRDRSAITVRTDTNHAFVRKKNGKVVLRSPSGKGADRVDTNAGREVKEAERAFLTSQAKLARELTMNAKGVYARQRNAAALEIEVLRLAKALEVKGRHRAALIAKKLDVSAKTVRQIIRKANLTERT